MRPTKTRSIGCIPECRRFRPLPESVETADGQECITEEVVTIGLDMLEAMRLVDAEGMNQEEAARNMEVSAPTLCRILGQGRQLAALALTTGKMIIIEGGNIMYGNQMHGRHGHNCCPGRGGRQGAMQGGGACSRREGMGRGQCMGRAQGMGRGRCGAGRGMCLRGNSQAGARETAAENADPATLAHKEQ